MVLIKRSSICQLFSNCGQHFVSNQSLFKRQYTISQTDIRYSALNNYLHRPTAYHLSTENFHSISELHQWVVRLIPCCNWKISFLVWLFPHCFFFAISFVVSRSLKWYSSIELQSKLQSLHLFGWHFQLNIKSHRVTIGIQYPSQYLHCWQVIDI